jgi:hypothetical protein
MFLRFVNFGCSLIVVTILSLTLFVFHATKSLPSRGGFPAWANGTNPWTQYLLLSVACISLFACLIVFWGYWKGGHKRAEKLTVYYQTIAVCFFMFSLVMWIVAAGLYQNQKANGKGQDLWGWSCKKNTRETLFHNDIDYALLCRLQVSWLNLADCMLQSFLGANTDGIRTGAWCVLSSKSYLKF